MFLLHNEMEKDAFLCFLLFNLELHFYFPFLIEQTGHICTEHMKLIIFPVRKVLCFVFYEYHPEINKDI